MNANKFLDYSKKLFKETLDIRRHLHQYPELSFKEFETSKYIQKKLKEFEIIDFEIIEKTGILGSLFPYQKSKKSVVLRADIDALPIIEKNNIPYKSKNEGVMHACGHDFHTTSLLTTLRIIKEFEKEPKVNIIFLFQPAEEKLPGGAKLILESKVIEKYNPSIFIGQHVYPELESGKFGLCGGEYMASADEIYITLKGKGGHGAMPHLTQDLVLIASQLIVNLQAVVSRYLPPNLPAVLTFGKFIANGATNIIPSEIKIDGTFRTFNEEWRTKAKNFIKDFCLNHCKSFDVECNLEILHGYPVLFNDYDLTNKCFDVFETFLEKENIVKLEKRMTSEDFAYYSQKYPSVFYRVGVKSKDFKEVRNLHTPIFDLDEETLITAPVLMAYISLNIL